MKKTTIERLPAWDKATGALHVIIETSKGSRNKLRFDPQHGLFELRKILPSGMVFPYNFGFVPSTKADDGDPIDVLVFLDQSVPAGCLIPSRLIGVIEGEELEDGNAERNDRLVAVPFNDKEQDDLHSLKTMNKKFIAEIEHFFVSYHDLDGKKFHLLACRGPSHAKELVRKATRGRS